MKLISLTLDHIRSYVHQTIQFYSDSQVITGDIGSGKSTILYAIEFALFGNLKYDTTGQSLLRHGAKKGSVTLTFSLHQDIYEIHRTLVQTKTSVASSNGYMKKNGMLTELTSSQLKAYIAEITQFPVQNLDVYRYCVYCAQEQMKTLIQGQIQDRITSFREMFGLNHYQRIVQQSDILKRFIKEKTQFIEGQLTRVPIVEQQIEQVTTYIKQLQIELLHQEIQTIQPQVEKHLEQEQHKQRLTQELTQLQLSNQTTQQAQTTILETQRAQLEQAQITHNNLQQKKTQCPAIYDAQRYEQLREKLLQKPDASILEIYQQYQTLLAQKNTLDGQYAQLCKQPAVSAPIKEHLDNAQQLFEQEKEQYLSKKSLLSSLQEQLTLLLTKNQQISTLTICPTCEQVVDESHKKHMHQALEQNHMQLQSQLSNLTQQISQELPRLQEKKKQLAQLTQTQQEHVVSYATYQQTQQTLRQILEQKTQIEQRIQTLGFDQSTYDAYLKQLADYQKLVSEFTVLETQKKQYELGREIDSLLVTQSTRITQLQADIQTQTQRVLTIKQMYETNQRTLQTKLEHITQSLLETTPIYVRHQQLSAQYALAKQQQTDYQQQLVRLFEEQTQLKLIQQQKEHYAYYKSFIAGEFITTMQTIETQLFSQIVFEFNQLFQEWFVLLLDSKELTCQLDTTFTPHLQQNGFDVEYQQLSGGEKTAIALAYRLALSQTLTRVHSAIQLKGFLILDEPTDGFSAQQLERFIDIVQKLSHTQLIIVSHEEHIQSMVNHTIHIDKQHATSCVRV
jgi:DNA repair protein SbcC/Rad50